MSFGGDSGTIGGPPGYPPGQGPPPYVPPPSPKRSGSTALLITLSVVAATVAVLAILLVLRDDSDDRAGGDDQDRSTTTRPVKGQTDSDVSTTVDPGVDVTTTSEPSGPTGDGATGGGGTIVTLPTTTTSTTTIYVPPPPPPTTRTSGPFRATVVRTCGSDPVPGEPCFLAVRTAASSTAAEVRPRRLYEGDALEVDCAVYGESVKATLLPRSTSVWVRDLDGYFMSGAFLEIDGWDIYSVTVPC